MTTFRLNIVFTGVDFDDDQVFETLAEVPHILWRAQGAFATATATADADSPLQAAEAVVQQVIDRVPSASPMRLDEDLVAISDVASRVGVTREAVRNWANGARHANFPLPRGIVGDRIKVWAWSDVNAWLRENLNLGDPEECPAAHDAALINAAFSDFLKRQSAVAAKATTWSVATTVSASTETRASSYPEKRPPWVTQRERMRLPVTAGLGYAAA
jgi:predicted DNA-binding transcriptional regulator AlpA